MVLDCVSVRYVVGCPGNAEGRLGQFSQALESSETSPVHQWKDTGVLETQWHSQALRLFLNSPSYSGDL